MGLLGADTAPGAYARDAPKHSKPLKFIAGTANARECTANANEFLYTKIYEEGANVASRSSFKWRV